jgi:quercetin dioxygenase-like cupin family protein
MIPNYYVGNLNYDAKNGGHRGWVVGTFMEDDTVRKNESVEILYWEFPKGQIDHPTKTSTIIEVTIIIEGSIAGDIEGKPLTLKKGEYIVIKPGTVNNIAKEALSHVVGLTIKAPSDPNAKKIVNTVKRSYRVILSNIL